MPHLKPLKGRLLIAEPSILNDSSFNRAIILITEHTDSNSIGFILNRPLEYTIQDLLPEIECNFRVYQGGPVEQDNLYFVHKVPNLIPDSIEVDNGIFWGGNFESLKFLLNNGTLEKTDIRFFLGYSGWSKHQLEDDYSSYPWTSYQELCSDNYQGFLDQPNVWSVFGSKVDFIQAHWTCK